MVGCIWAGACLRSSRCDDLWCRLCLLCVISVGRGCVLCMVLFSFSYSIFPCSYALPIFGFFLQLQRRFYLPRVFERRRVKAICSRPPLPPGAWGFVKTHRRTPAPHLRGRGRSTCPATSQEPPNNTSLGPNPSPVDRPPFPGGKAGAADRWREALAGGAGSTQKQHKRPQQQQ